MTIPFTGTGGLFTRLGAIGNFISDVNIFQNTPCPTDTQSIILQYPLDNDAAFIDGIESALTSQQQSSGGIISQLNSYSIATVNGMVYQDNPLLSSSNLQASLVEIIKQLNSSSNTVKSCVIGSSVSAAGSNLGNGVCVCSKLRRDGFIQENSFAENITLQCSGDSTSSSSVAGNESFLLTGQVPFSVFDWRWPGGSGATQTLSAINASQDAGQGNILTNSDFESFTSNTPNNWTVLVGTPGTTILKNTSSPYIGTADLEFVGNGTELTSIAQTIGVQTTGSISNLQQYAFTLWLKVNSVPSTGVLEIALLDGSNTIITDEQGNQNIVLIDLTAATTSFVAHSGVFRTPYILPSTVKIAVRLTTALQSGKQVFIDHLSLGQMTLAYTGGPSFAIFSGSNNFYVPDYFTATITNNRGGSSDNKNFQTLFARLFSMPSLGLLLPSSGSPTIPDSLIES